MAGLAAGPGFLPAQAPFDQPSPPFYATFFYPWHPIWSDNGHSPPLNWFSNYLPDTNPCVFDPATELYNSTDDAIIYWQLRKMAHARLEVAISSWWGQDHKTDRAFRKIITDVMERPDNPYPNLRWALYYEKESLGDPAVEELVRDLNFIRNDYAMRRAYLRIGGKPVIFVYAAAGDAAGMAARWAAARAQSNFYVVLKVYPGYRNDPNQPDSWHQYAPANRTDNQQPYSFMVSPGFWHDGQAPRLPRDLAAFRTAVSAMVALPVTWKLIETWNEWGEGTSVEPGDQVVQTRTGAAVLDPAGVPFKNLYVEALSELLPPLEAGTGAPSSASEPRFTPAGLVNAASMRAGAAAPGQIISIFGERLCPVTGVTAAAGSAGIIAGTLADVQVFFDCSPAPLLYVQAGQINAVVPYAMAGKTMTQVRVEFAGRPSYVATLPVTDSAPAIFTLDSSGRGQAAVLNQDFTVNSPSNPAPRGSAVMLFATGEGQTEPAGIDGKLALDALPAPRLPVAVFIGGIRAEVLYAGAAPTFVAGTLQVNARVPADLQAGGAVPVLLTVGGNTSPAAVTLAIQ